MNKLTRSASSRAENTENTGNTENMENMEMLIDFTVSLVTLIGKFEFICNNNKSVSTELYLTGINRCVPHAR